MGIVSTNGKGVLKLVLKPQASDLSSAVVLDQLRRNGTPAFPAQAPVHSCWPCMETQHTSHTFIYSHSVLTSWGANSESTGVQDTAATYIYTHIYIYIYMYIYVVIIIITIMTYIQNIASA